MTWWTDGNINSREHTHKDMNLHIKTERLTPLGSNNLHHSRFRRLGTSLLYSNNATECNPCNANEHHLHRWYIYLDIQIDDFAHMWNLVLSMHITKHGCWSLSYNKQSRALISTPPPTASHLQPWAIERNSFYVKWLLRIYPLLGTLYTPQV